jgi:membrane fusion protein (multidrug efflux system)
MQCAERAHRATLLLATEAQFALPRVTLEGDAMAAVDRRVEFFAAAAAFAALLGCKEAAPPAASPEVVVAPVEARDFPVVSEWLGTTEGAVDAEIRAQVAGYLVSREYQEGQVVKKDDLLFRINPAPFKAALAEANGRLGSARANLERNRLDVARYKPLLADGAVSQQEYDNAFQRERSSAADVESAQAAVETAKINLGFTEIRSPVDGIAGVANAQLGDLVGPAAGALTTVSQLDPILVSFPLSEQEYLRFAPAIGEAVKAGEFRAEVGLVLADGSLFPQKGVAYPAGGGIDPRTGTITIKARFANPGNVLRAGQFARVRAQTQILKGALVVPQRAVMDLQGQKQIAVIGPEDKVEVRTVKLGPKSGSEQVVESGLAAGDRVVVEGFQKIRPGMTVVAKAVIPDVAAPPPGKNAEN